MRNRHGNGISIGGQQGQFSRGAFRSDSLSPLPRLPSSPSFPDHSSSPRNQEGEAWIKCADPSTGRLYFSNVETNEVRFDAPEGVAPPPPPPPPRRMPAGARNAAEPFPCAADAESAAVCAFPLPTKRVFEGGVEYFPHPPRDLGWRTLARSETYIGTIGPSGRTEGIVESGRWSRTDSSRRLRKLEEKAFQKGAYHTGLPTVVDAQTGKLLRQGEQPAWQQVGERDTAKEDPYTKVVSGTRMAAVSRSVSTASMAKMWGHLGQRAPRASPQQRMASQPKLAAQQQQWEELAAMRRRQQQQENLEPHSASTAARLPLPMSASALPPQLMLEAPQQGMSPMWSAPPQRGEVQVNRHGSISISGASGSRWQQQQQQQQEQEQLATPQPRFSPPPPQQQQQQQQQRAAVAEPRVAPIPNASTTYRPVVMMCRALHPCDAEQSDELSFRAGDVVECSSFNGPSAGWYIGRVQGTEKWGAFPANFVEKMDEASAEGSQRWRRDGPSL